MNEEMLLLFKDIIAAKIGLRIRSHDNESLSNHISLRTSQLGLNSTSDYYRLIVSDTHEGRLELKALIALLTVGESYFFRDNGQFKLLKEVVLPELIERRSVERELRLWSAGCSTGEEAYSLAILLDEVLPERHGWKVSIIGTDIRDDFLKKARAGVYGNWSFRQVDESIKKRYFRKKRGNFALDDRIMTMVSFFPLNLLDCDLPDYAQGLCNFDLILCRNVFVYYNRQSVAKMLEKLSSVLNIGGYLMTAHGELYSVPLGSLKTKVFAESVVYVKRESVPVAVKVSEEFKGIAGLTPSIINLQTAVAVALPSAHAEKPDEGMEEIQTLFKRGLYSSVIEKALALLKTGSNDFHLMYLCGAAYANLGELEKAGEHLKRAITADRLAPEPYYLLALIAEEEGDSEKAKEALNKAIYLKKEFVAAYIELASVYEREGNIKKAEKLRSAALDEVKSLPVDLPLDMFENTTAGEIATYIKKALGV